MRRSSPSAHCASARFVSYTKTKHLSWLVLGARRSRHASLAPRREILRPSLRDVTRNRGHSRLYAPPNRPPLLRKHRRGMLRLRRVAGARTLRVCREVVTTQTGLSMTTLLGRLRSAFSTIERRARRRWVLRMTVLSRCCASPGTCYQGNT